MTVSITRIPDELASNATVTFVPDVAKNTSEGGISGRKVMRPVLRNYTITINPDFADEMQAIVMAARGMRWPLAMRDYAAYVLTAELAEISADGTQAKIGKNWTPSTGPLSYFERVLIPDGPLVVAINDVITVSGWTLGDYGILTLSPALDPAYDTVAISCNYLKPVCMLDSPSATTYSAGLGSTLYQFHDVRLEEIFEAELVALTTGVTGGGGGGGGGGVSEGGSGGVGAPDAPVITLLRAAGAHNTLFNIADHGTTKVSQLDVYGTSANSAATVTVYIDSVLDGTTTTDGSGNWTYAAGIMSDAAHVVTATVTVGSDTSADSSDFHVTVAPGITSLPAGISIGDNLVNNKAFSWGGEGFVTNSTNQTAGHVNTACCIVADTHTLDFTLKSTDLYTDFSTSNRSEIAMTARYPEGTTFNFSFQAWLDGSSPVNDDSGSGKWCVFPFQMHDSGGSSPVVEGNLGGDANHTGTTGDMFCLDKFNGSTYSQVARDSGNLARGSYHNFDAIIKVHATAGQLTLYKNGVLFGIYSGPLHETPDYYLKMGMYRGPTPGEDQDQHFKLRNFQCIRT